MKRLGGDVAVVVLSYRRYRLLERCLNSIERNNTDGYDFIILQDGCTHPTTGEDVADPEFIEKSIEVAEAADLPNKEIRVNEYHTGIAHMRDATLSLLEDEYDLVMQIENDVTLGKNALSLLESISRQFPQHLSTIYKERDYDKIRDPEVRLNHVGITKMNHLYTFAMWSELYEKIEDAWKFYMESCERGYYNHRDADSARAKIPGLHLTYSDSALVQMIINEGVGVVVPEISRARYHGDEGFAAHGNEGPLQFDQDENIEVWEVVKDYV